MTHQFSIDWRNKRNRFASIPQNYNTMHYSISSYCTETKTNMGSKSDLNEYFSAPTYLTQLKNLPNPLQKNLADTLPKTEETKPTLRKSESLNTPMRDKPTPQVTQTTFASIGNFISGVFNVITSAMPFQKRPRPSESFDDFIYQAEPDFWLPAKNEQQNKNNCSERSGQSENNSHLNMSVDCKEAAAHCEDKLSLVKNLLASNSVAPKTAKPAKSARLRRPKKVFVQPEEIEDSYDEPFDPEDIVRSANNDFVECVVHVRNAVTDLVEIESPVMRVKMAPLDALKVQQEDKIVDNIKLDKPEIVVDDSYVKMEIIQTCEDKCSQLKALLLERRKNNRTRSNPSVSSLIEEKYEERLSPNRPISISNSQNKKFKNPNRLNVDKRSKCRVRKNIEEDMKFAQEVDPDLLSSAENALQLAFKNLKIEKMPKSKNRVCSSAEYSPTLTKNSPRMGKLRKLTHLPSKDSSMESLSNKDCAFNEISGRFHKNSTSDSEDSFQIVFTDSPQHSPRIRKTSDCDSEDSFIVFEDESPDSCYTSTDVFGHETKDSDCSDYNSDYSDSGQDTCKLAHTFSRTISDLTDDSLYEEDAVLPSSRPYSDSEDEVDSAVRTVEPILEEEAEELEAEEQDSGLLMNDAKREKRKKLPRKMVRFAETPPAVHVMHVWSFAARQARRGHWDQYALDRGRFKRRIADVDMAISWVLKPQHRSRITFQRFMPWWHQQRRLELAEKKKRDEEEKRRKEEAKRAEEEEEDAKRIEESRVEGSVRDSVDVDVDSSNDEKVAEDLLKENSVKNDIDITKVGDAAIIGNCVEDDKDKEIGDRVEIADIKDGKDEESNNIVKDEKDSKGDTPATKPASVIKRHYDSKGNLIVNDSAGNAKIEKPKAIPKPPVNNTKKPLRLVIKGNAVKNMVSANNKVNVVKNVVKKPEPPKIGRYYDIENTVVCGKGYYGIDSNVGGKSYIVPINKVAETKT